MPTKQDYSDADKLAFRQKDYLTLFETVYKARMNVLAAYIGSIKDIQLDLNQLVSTCLVETKDIVDELWASSQDFLTKNQDDLLKKLLDKPPF